MRNSFNCLKPHHLNGAYRSSWKTEVCFQGDILFYRVAPVSDYEFIMRYAAKNSEDSLNIRQLQKKYKSTFMYNPDAQINQPETHVSQRITVPADFFQQANKAAFQDVKNALDSFPLKALGLTLLEIHPKSKQHYLSGLETGEIKSDATKRAIQEQLMSD